MGNVIHERICEGCGEPITEDDREIRTDDGYWVHWRCRPNATIVHCPHCGSFASRCQEDMPDGSTKCMVTGKSV